MQTVSSLSDNMIKFIEAKRNWVRNHFTPDSIKKYDTIDGKFKLLDTIIKSNWIEKHETAKLQSLGITLGDIIVQDMNFIWVEIDEDGETVPAVRHQHHTTTADPERVTVGGGVGQQGSRRAVVEPAPRRRGDRHTHPPSHRVERCLLITSV